MTACTAPYELGSPLGPVTPVPHRNATGSHLTANYTPSAYPLTSLPHLYAPHRPAARYLLAEIWHGPCSLPRSGAHVPPVGLRQYFLDFARTIYPYRPLECAEAIPPPHQPQPQPTMYNTDNDRPLIDSIDAILAECYGERTVVCASSYSCEIWREECPLPVEYETYHDPLPDAAGRRRLRSRLLEGQA